MKRLLFLLTFLLAPLTLLGQSVTLAWDPNPETDLAGYRMYRADGTNDFNIVATITAPGTNLFQNNLTRGLTYRWRVTAFNEADLESLPSNTVSYTVPKVPQPPKALRIKTADVRLNYNGTSFLGTVTNVYTIRQLQRAAQ